MSGQTKYESPFENPEPINISLVLSKYFKYWYLFAISIFICLVVAYLYIRYTPPQYYISGTLYIKDEKSSSAPPTNVFNDFSGTGSAKNLDNEIGFLKSKVLMERVLSELSLHTTYHITGRIQEQEVYQGDLPIKLIVNKLNSTSFNTIVKIHVKDNNSFELEDEDHSISLHRFGQQVHKPYGIFTVVAAPNINKNDDVHRPIIVRFHDIKYLAKIYSNNLNVSQYNKLASILTLSLTDRVPNKGRVILDKLIDVYNMEASEDKNLAASNTLAFIDERLVYLGAELSDVERNVEQFKRQNEVADVKSQVGQYLSESSIYNKQLTEGGVQIEILESIEQYIRKEENLHQMIPNAFTVQDPVLSGLITKFNELQLDRERLLRVAQQDNPLVKNVEEQLSHLRENIRENLGNAKNSIIINQRNIQAKSGQFGNKIQNVPTIERELLEIGRQQEIKQSLYLYLLQKREESAMALAATVSNSRVIDPAMPEDLPFSPNKTTVFLGAIMLGLGLPFAFVYVKGMLNDKVQLQKDIEKATPTPVLGGISHSTSPTSLLVTKENRSPAAEMFHMIRTNLTFATAGKENKVVLVTSSMRGEGKTFFSQNLGASMALTGKKVVVINLDFRKPSPIQGQGVGATLGVSDFLISDQIILEDIIKPSQAVAGLSLIPAGSIASNPVELMMSPKIEKMIGTLKESFDYIIIDAAPVGEVSDAFSLAPFIDATVYVIRINFTPKDKVSSIDKIYKEKKLKNPLIVLNDI